MNPFYRSKTGPVEENVTAWLNKELPEAWISTLCSVSVPSICPLQLPVTSIRSSSRYRQLGSMRIIPLDTLLSVSSALKSARNPVLSITNGPGTGG